MIRVTGWVKFIGDRIPMACEGFGVRIQGSLHNQWLLTCEPEIWRYIAVCAPHTGFDAGWVAIDFSNCPSEDPIMFSGFQCEVLYEPDVDESGCHRWSSIGSEFQVHPNAKEPTIERPHEGGDCYVFMADGETGVDRWAGWNVKDLYRTPQGATIRVSGFVRFVNSVPKAAAGFGIAIQGNLCQAWIDTCRPDAWCYVTASAPFLEAEEGWVVIIFDGCEKVDGPVLFAGFQLEILGAK